MTILDIPYVSQEDEGADINGKDIYNDCGPTCGVMLIRAYTPEKTFTVNEFYNDMGFKKEGTTNLIQIKEALKKHGISSDRKVGLKISDLETFINQKRPPIALMHYGVLRQNGIKTYNRSARFHFVVLVGIDESFIYLNDPLWPGTKGKNFPIPRDIWMKAWGGESFHNEKGVQAAMQFQALIPTHPVDTGEMKLPEGAIRMKVIFNDYMNVRSGAGINNNAYSKIPSGAIVTILETKTDGTDVWGQLGPDSWVAIKFRGNIYLEPVAPVVDDPGDQSAVEQKEEKREENKMSDKQNVNAGLESKDHLSMETTDNLSLGAIMAELSEIKAILVDMKKNMAAGNLEITGQADDEQITEDPGSTTPEEPEIPEIPEEPETPEAPKEPVIDTVEVFTDRKNGAVYLSFIYNIHEKSKKPEFQFYPGDSKPVSERVFIKSGTKLKVIPDSQVEGDGGKTGWKLDKNEWFKTMKGSAEVPVGIDLYILDKFIKK